MVKLALMKYILSLGVLVLFISCRKNRPLFDGVNCSGNCYVLTGKITDTPSNAGIAGADIRFYYRPAGYTIFDNTKYLGKAMTNGNGEYKFQFDGSNYKTRS